MSRDDRGGNGPLGLGGMGLPIGVGDGGVGASPEDLREKWMAELPVFALAMAINEGIKKRFKIERAIFDPDGASLLIDDKDTDSKFIVRAEAFRK